MFRAILSFYSMLVRDFFGAMSAKLEQCWRGICRLLKKNWPFQNKNRWKVTRCCLDDIALDFFSAMLPGAYWTTFLCNVFPGGLKHHWQDFFLCNDVWSLSDNIAEGFNLCNVVLRVLRQHCTGILHVQYCLEPVGQHCTRKLHVQCWPMANKHLLWGTQPIHTMLCRSCWDNIT